MIRILFYGQDGRHSVEQARYSNPRKSLRINASSTPSYETILDGLNTIDLWKETFHVVCLFSYEMGCILQRLPMPGNLPPDYPVMAAFAFSQPDSPDSNDPAKYRDDAAGKFVALPEGSELQEHIRDSRFQTRPGKPELQTGPGKSQMVRQSGFDLGRSRLPFQKSEYSRHIESIHEKIRDGLSYQVNFTAPVQVPFSGNPEELFHWLRRRYPSPHSVFIDLLDRQIVSISPELFFQMQSVQTYSPAHGEKAARRHAKSNTKTFSSGYRLEVRPMKGTVRASKDPVQDELLKEKLMESAKDRAELAMITDLLRNDLGKISPAGAVSLDKAIQPESYTYVHQLTSVITGFHKTGNLADIVPSLFPSGSITGAPRRETMKIINQEEAGHYRGVYTGSLGLINKDEARFNVAIRTAEVCKGSLRYGAGGGITLGSAAEQEWKELHWKARPVKTDLPGLIETMALKRGRIKNKSQHLNRMLRSARILGIVPGLTDTDESDNDRSNDPVARSRNSNIQENAKQILNDYFSDLESNHGSGTFRLRVHLSAKGEVSHQIQNLENVSQQSHSNPWRLVLASHPMSSKDRWLLHKVDRRSCYNEGLAKARDSGYDEILFYNEKNEITEGSITNVFYLMNGHWFTPPLRCGLLPGIQRSKILKRWPQYVALRPLQLKELSRVQRIVLVNSLRGLVEATL
ncbi:MAG: chorismate-binding protein [Leptospiraceae bacterium]